MHRSRKRIAVVGAGVAGLGAAWALSRRHHVTLIEKAPRLGGHANTVDLDTASGPMAVDTGFIVYNKPAYPNLTHLFSHLDVPTEPSDMSFAVSIGGGRREYSGSLAGFFAQPANLFRPDHWRMINDLVRFYREAAGMNLNNLCPDITLGELLHQGAYSDVFRQNHILPMGAAIWSCSTAQMLAFPARSFIEFFENHALLNLGARPRWRTVTGGSREYVGRIEASMSAEVRTGLSIASIHRAPSGVTLRFEDGTRSHFDELVLATHADQALALLGPDATASERDILGAFSYQRNRTLLHSDRALMPKRRRAWSSWNYLAEESDSPERRVAVTYWMNRLQNLETQEPILVTLNPHQDPAPGTKLGEFSYDHPVFDSAALKAQPRIPEIQGGHFTWFCGSYCGYGFHEDGLQAGLAVAASLGAPAPWHDNITPRSPAAYCAWRADMMAAAE